MTKDRYNARSLAAGLILACGFAIGLWNTSEGQTESGSSEVTQLQSYLERLGLDDLNIVVLREQLKQQPDRSERFAIATRLADYYTKQIQENQNNEKLQLAARKQIHDLQREYPGLNHPRFSVAVLSVEFSQAQTRFFTWVTSRQTEKEEQDKLAKQFGAIDRQWQSIVKATRSQLDKENKAQKVLGNSEPKTASDELIAIMSQLEFIGGWQKYYQSILSKTNRPQHLAESRKNFLSLIGVSSIKELAKLKPEEVELEISWVSRSILGLAMASSGESTNHSATLFRFLTDPRVPLSIRSEIDWWEFQSAALARQWKKATEILRQKLESGEVRENARLWLSGIQCFKLAEDDDKVRDLIRYSLQGLVRENQFQTAQKFCEDNPDWIDDSKFVFQWLKAQQEYELGEKNSKRSHFANCKKWMESAIRSREPTINKLDLARCRYLLAWAEFRLGKFTRSAKLFRQASLGLRLHDPETAAKALWIRVIAIRNQDSSESSSRKIVTALNEIRRLFPGSAYDEKAAFELSKLRAAGSSILETIAKLQKIPSDNSAYAQAQSEIARLYFKAVKEGKGTPEQRTQRMKDFQSAVRKILNDSEVDASAKAKSAALMIESLLGEETPKTDEAQQWLKLAKAAVGEVAKRNSDLRFQEYRIAKQTGDSKNMVAQAKWLSSSDNSNRSYKVAGLIYLAKHLDQQIANAKNEDRSTLIADAESTYQKLSDLLGQNREALKTKANARAALSRLSDLQALNGKTSEAIENYEKLRQALPNYQRYILRLAQLKSKAGKPDSAIELWRKLATGSKAGSNAWYEAKYNIAKILSKEDQKTAQSILSQTRRLSPEMPEEWKTKFDDLAESIKKQDIP